MKRISHRITIQAPVNVIWDTTLDVESWHTWTPTISSIRKVTSGPLRVGSRVEIKQPAQSEAEWEISDLEENRVFAWTSQRKGMHMKAIHTLEAVQNGTEHTLSIEADGWLVSLLWPMLRPMLLHALKQENEGMKRFTELKSEAVEKL